MLLTVKDALGNDATVIAQGQATPTDRSGMIVGTDASQALLNANAARSGWFFQNLGTEPMFINELAADATSQPVDGDGSIMVPPGASFPPCGYPVPPGQVNVTGTAGQFYVAREW